MTKKANLKSPWLLHVEIRKVFGNFADPDLTIIRNFRGAEGLNELSIPTLGRSAYPNDLPTLRLNLVDLKPNFIMLQNLVL